MKELFVQNKKYVKKYA